METWLYMADGHKHFSEHRTGDRICFLGLRIEGLGFTGHRVYRAFSYPPNPKPCINAGPYVKARASEKSGSLRHEW